MMEYWNDAFPLVHIPSTPSGEPVLSQSKDRLIARLTSEIFLSSLRRKIYKVC